MNFFESQDTAKRNTGRLIFLFAMAVISLIIITNLLVMVVFGFLTTEGRGGASASSQFDWGIFLAVSAGVLGVILFGSLYKMAALGGGGARVAEMLNGRLLLQGSDDFYERRVLNVVEEMALAAGTPVPPVYLLDEQGINAFAAGYTPGDAVIGVTRGTINSLSRDELQGVIAHEFSHILHGDMRINIRLIAILHGILILGILGYYLLRGGAYSRRSKDSGGIVALGLGLMVVGYVGTFFGNLIKAAVSRQREFLADASAVQYTRNPDGIAGALMRIATHEGRSYLENPSGMEISHALFEEGVFTRLRGLYATHPPLDQRIRAILPDWNGEYDLPALTGVDVDENVTGQKPDQAATGAHERAKAVLTGALGVLVTDKIIDQIGQPGEPQIERARELLASMPVPLLEAAHDPSAARAVIYWLVLDDDDEIKSQQLRFLEQSADTGIYRELVKLIDEIPQQSAEYRLPLIQITLNTMRQLSAPQYRLFKQNLNALIKMDNKIDLFEWALQKIVLGNLDAIFEKKGPKRIGRKELKNCKKSVAILLSILAVSDRASTAKPQLGFDQALEKLGGMKLDIMDSSAISFEDLNDALDELAELKPLQKPALLKACVACIAADDKLAPIEVELLRAIGSTLDCPIPPLKIASGKN